MSNSYTTSNNSLSEDVLSSMSSAYIQEEIDSAVKLEKIKEGDKLIMEVPSISTLPDSYEEFCEKKSKQFLLYGIHPYFRDTIASSDLKEVNDQISTANKYSSRFPYIFILIFGTGFDHWYKVNPVLGLTIKTNGWLPFFLRFVVIPNFIGSLFQKYYFYPRQQAQSQIIINKYPFSQDIEQNPLCKKAFEDFKLYQQKLKLQNQESSDKGDNQIEVNKQQQKEEVGQENN